MRGPAWSLLALLLPGCVGPGSRYFHDPLPYGLRAVESPLVNALNQALDTQQVALGGPHDGVAYRAASRRLWRNLREPDRAVRDEDDREDELRARARRLLERGPTALEPWSRRYARGWGQSLERQLASVSAVPNYTLHLLGSGLFFRDDVEWFEERGLPGPLAIALGWASSTLGELGNEVVELDSTSPDDALFDLLVFDAASKLLFSLDPVARFFSRDLRMRSWSFLPMYGLESERLRNVGANIAVKIPLPVLDRVRLFALGGMTSLVGVSVEDALFGCNLSVGAGLAVRDLDPSRPSLRVAGGLFLDRGDSVLLSLIVHGSDDLAVRLEVYPLPGLGHALPLGLWLAPAAYLAVDDRGGVSFGVSLSVPGVGLAN